MITWCVLHFTARAFIWHHVVLLVYFTAITLVLLSWQERRAITDIKGFVRRFMLGMVIKLMGSLVLLFVLLRLAPKDITNQLTVTFALLYFAFLIFSTVRLTMILRRVSKPV